jgi:cytoskeletal protein CcmA (bactofilin family)
MGVFSKSDKQSSTNVTTIIPLGTCIIGGINAKGTVLINGKFEGVILDAEVVSIGLTGEIIGDVQAKNLIVNGLFDGKIDCDKIQILSKGKVIGEVRYNELEIEKNGQFEGKGIKKNSQLKSRYTEVENKLNKILLAPSTVNHDKS